MKIQSRGTVNTGADNLYYVVFSKWIAPPTYMWPLLLSASEYGAW